MAGWQRVLAGVLGGAAVLVVFIAWAAARHVLLPALTILGVVVAGAIYWLHSLHEKVVPSRWGDYRK